ncbi:hypothetical protein JVT61DRAFT_11463 [Boletus reticuloceps]|uniref:Uncharacterized protein n=1 Tax=Boletus reticuloceps TaxID=495285 RepID=A0A8I2YVP0_9AGAM|nr:hypothetical protein JVT61DRAFT_11463 [Boletus reticuloceps]
MPWDKWKPERTDANTLGSIITHRIIWIDLLVIETLYLTKDMVDVDEKLDAALRQIRDTSVCYARQNCVCQSQVDLHLGKGDSDSDNSEHALDSDPGGDDKGLRDGDDTCSNMDIGVNWSSDSDLEISATNVGNLLKPHELATMQAWPPLKPLLDWDTVLHHDITLTM